MDTPDIPQPDPEVEEDTSQLQEKVKHMEKKFEDLLSAASEDQEEGSNYQN